MEYVRRDLRSVMELMNGSNFTDEHFLVVTYNLLCAINYMHRANIIHRDLKPANILVTNMSTVKICDFGLARSIKGERPMSPHVGSRYYRAPEVICL